MRKINHLWGIRTKEGLTAYAFFTKDEALSELNALSSCGVFYEKDECEIIKLIPVVKKQ